MTKTENYQLNQWEPADPIRRTDFNADNAAIDAAIKAVADTAASKASAESVSALSESVNSQITALAEALGTGGQNCRIAWGSYTGTGTYGASNPTMLTFDFTPLVVWVYTASSSTSIRLTSGGLKAMYESSSCTVSWSGHSVNWYCASGAAGQLNASGDTYLYIAIGY